MMDITRNSLVLFACIGSVAYAGYTLTAPVVVTSAIAYGSLVDARDSADSTQYIGCYMQVFGSTSTALSGSCVARNTSGAVLSCATTDPNELEVIASLDQHDSTYLQLSNGDGQFNNPPPPPTTSP